MTNEQNFYQQYAVMAMEQQIKYGIPASITLAQMAIESSYGTSESATRDNNYFGIKKGSSWVGGVGYYDDDNPHEAFRKYSSINQGIENHSAVLLHSNYQRHVPANNPLDYTGWAQGIKAGGYATDPDYVSKLVNTIQEYGLYNYDQFALQEASQRGVRCGYMKNNPSTQQQQFQIPYLDGNWSMPINLNNLEVTGMFNEPRPGHRHGGIDISTQKQYLPVFATEDNGKIVDIKNSPTAGNMIKIQYNHSGVIFETTYMHLSNINVSKGDTVNAGQQIGTSGNTGHSTGPHLHFEVQYYDSQHQAVKYDPVKYLAEISFRGNINARLDRHGQDLLAPVRLGMSYKQDYHTDNSLANITQSNDMNKWLAYLMANNGEQCKNQDLVSSLISHLLGSAFVVAMQLDNPQMSPSEVKAKVKTGQQKEDQEAKDSDKVVHRERETIDASKLSQAASLNFDAEYPEQQQGNNLALKG